ncbi:hypothetical protein Tco_0128248 [Tanacetum coccineum]
MIALGAPNREKRDFKNLTTTLGIVLGGDALSLKPTGIDSRRQLNILLPLEDGKVKDFQAREVISCIVFTLSIDNLKINSEEVRPAKQSCFASFLLKRLFSVSGDMLFIPNFSTKKLNLSHDKAFVKMSHKAIALLLSQYKGILLNLSHSLLVVISSIRFEHNTQIKKYIRLCTGDSGALLLFS